MYGKREHGFAVTGYGSAIAIAAALPLVLYFMVADGSVSELPGDLSAFLRSLVDQVRG